MYHTFLCFQIYKFTTSNKYLSKSFHKPENPTCERNIFALRCLITDMILLGYEHYLVICLAVSQAKTTYSQILTAAIFLSGSYSPNKVEHDRNLRSGNKTVYPTLGPTVRLNNFVTVKYQTKKLSLSLSACQALESSDDKPAKAICCKTSNCDNTRAEGKYIQAFCMPFWVAGIQTAVWA